MKKRIKLSPEAEDVIDYLAAKSLEDESFQKTIDDLFAKSDDEIKEGLAYYIKNKFPDYIDKGLEEEILTALRQDKNAGGNIIDLQRRSLTKRFGRMCDDGGCGGGCLGVRDRRVEWRE